MPRRQETSGSFEETSDVRCNQILGRFIVAATATAVLTILGLAGFAVAVAATRARECEARTHARPMVLSSARPVRVIVYRREDAR